MVILKPDVRNHEQMHPFGPRSQLFGGRTLNSGARVRCRPSELSVHGNRAWNPGPHTEAVEGSPKHVLGEAAQDLSAL
jgi:hypothetical protein